MKYQVFVLSSSLLYSFAYAQIVISNTSLGSLVTNVIVPQNIISLLFCYPLKGDIEYRPLFIFMGILDALVTLIPVTASLCWGYLDFGHATILKVASIVFPLLLEWKSLTRKDIQKSFIIMFALCFASLGAKQSLFWPNLSWGILLSLLSALGGSTLGVLQKHTGWQPNATVKYSQLAFNCLFLSFSQINFNYRFVILWVCYALQTKAINMYLKREKSAYKLSQVLSVKRVLSVILFTNWNHLYNVYYVMGIAILILL